MGTTQTVRYKGLSEIGLNRTKSNPTESTLLCKQAASHLTKITSFKQVF